MGGMFGDLIAGMLDPTDAEIRSNRIRHPKERCRLKKPHSFANDLEKDRYVSAIFDQYRSIPSHDLDYHINKRHQFLTITVTDEKIALEAATRFQNLHETHVWEEMQKTCGAATVTDYANLMFDYSKHAKRYTDLVLPIEDIYNRTAAFTLTKLGFVINKDGRDFYDAATTCFF